MSITSSFTLLGGLGRDAERRLWRQGILSWADYRRSGEGIFSETRHRRVLADIERAEAALANDDVDFFLSQLPAFARMRVWPLVANRAVYLDIETTGLAPADPPTTAVIYDGCQPRVFLAGRNLHTMPRFVPDSSVLVTYNGRRFDLPRLRCHAAIRFRQPHLDLAPVLRAAGYGPGLKTCERQLGVSRTRCTGLDGAHAVGLWHRFQTGDISALGELVAYNVEDAISLERVLVAAYNRSMLQYPNFRPVPPPRQPEVAPLTLLNAASSC